MKTNAELANDIALAIVQYVSDAADERHTYSAIRASITEALDAVRPPAPVADETGPRWGKPEGEWEWLKARVVGYRVRRYLDGAAPQYGKWIDRDPDSVALDWEMHEHAPKPVTRQQALAVLHAFRADHEVLRDGHRWTARLVRVVRRGR